MGPLSSSIARLLPLAATTLACAAPIAETGKPPPFIEDSPLAGPASTPCDALAHDEQERRCLSYDAACCTALAGRYRVGDELSRDPAFAALLYRHACELGDPGGCHHLGNMYFLGDGMPQDTERAIALYDKLCADGLPTACQVVGWLFEAGLGVRRDLSQAKRYYELSCNGGFEEGCRRLKSLGQKMLGMPSLPLMEVKP